MYEQELKLIDACETDLAAYRAVILALQSAQPQLDALLAVAKAKNQFFLSLVQMTGLPWSMVNDPLRTVLQPYADSAERAQADYDAEFKKVSDLQGQRWALKAQCQRDVFNLGSQDAPPSA